MFNTYNAKYPLMRWPLDHIFHSKQFTLAKMARLPGFGSDHFPVYVRLVLEEGADEVQDGVEPDQGDRREATNKIAAANG